MNNEWVEDINMNELEHGANQIVEGVEMFKQGEYRIALEMFEQGNGRVSGQANIMREHIPVQQFSEEVKKRLFGHLKGGKKDDNT